MKVSNWQNVIISWANALRLLDEPINDVLDLVKGSFFVKLLNKIRDIDQDGVSDISEADVYNVIENFLKDEYSGFRLLGYWDNDEVVLVSSVLLLWSSLESQSFRTPLFELDGAMQLKIQAFIQRFIETPSHLINRQLVMDAVLDITSDVETDEENSSFVSSPRTSSTPKRTSFNSSNYSPAMLALSEMRSLRSKVDLLNCEKQHLHEELEITKTQLIKTKTKLSQKEKELMRLCNQIANDDSEKAAFQEELKSDSGAYFSKNSSGESSLLKMELEDLKDVANKLRQDLESTVEENNNLVKQFNEEQNLRIEAENKCIELETRNTNLTCKLEELELMVTSLKNTCEEQGAIMAEKIKSMDDDSLCQSITDFETLGGIVDIKYSELKEELRVQSELLDEKKNEVVNLQVAKEAAENIIISLKADIDYLRSQLSLNSVAEVADCSHCNILENRLISLQKELTLKNDECEQVKTELAQKGLQLKCLCEAKLFCETKISELLEGNKKVVDEYNNQLEVIKEEMISLKCQLYEKNIAIECHKEETNFLNNCLKNKNFELNNLESEYNSINMSKDREISHLMKSVEHLNKEVKILQEQLFGGSNKSVALPCYSASKWRQMLSKELVTANEEVAQELIAFHESLQYKSLKIAELSLEIKQLKCELDDKDTLNRELNERLSILSQKYKQTTEEYQANKNAFAQLQSKMAVLEMNEKRLNQDIIKKNKQIEVTDFELKEIWKLLKQKFYTIDIEMDTCMLKGKSDLEDILKFIDYMCEKWKDNRKLINHLNIAVNELEAENAEKTAEIKTYESKFLKLSSVNNVTPSTHCSDADTSVYNKLKKIESDYENNMIKLQDTLEKLNEANLHLESKTKRISELQSEVNRMNEELKEKLQLIECLQQNVNLYEHEKSILEKKLSNRSQTSQSSRFTDESAKQDHNQRGPHKTAEETISFEDKLSISFQEKLFDLQARMKAQHEEETKCLVEGYCKKIDQLKVKVKKDCAHIEHLSSELWETSDRLLLAQQEADALRSQLSKTKAVIAEQQFQQNRGTEDCHSFMWLGGIEAGDYMDELVAAATKRGFQCGHTQADSHSGSGFQNDDEMFNQECLEDLKAGICRIPSPFGRLSCPAESTRLDDDSSEVFLVPKDKPRKTKGSITYRKPGPPTPSISAARHSLPGNERFELRKGLREQNSNINSGRSRLSQLFGSINLTKTKNVPESPIPKTKRKGFFQRTFKNRENLPPKP